MPSQAAVAVAGLAFGDRKADRREPGYNRRKACSARKVIDFHRTTRAEHRLFEEKPDRKAEASENGAVGKDCADAQADSAAILRKKRIERLTLFFGGKWG